MLQEANVVPGVQSCLLQLVPAPADPVKLPAFPDQDPQEEIPASQRAGSDRGEVCSLLSFAIRGGTSLYFSLSRTQAWQSERW